DDVAACHPSQWLAATLFGWPAATMIDADAPLVRWQMAWPAENAVAPWSALAAWTPDPYLVAWFQNRAAIDPALSRAAHYIPPSLRGAGAGPLPQDAGGIAPVRSGAGEQSRAGGGGDHRPARQRQDDLGGAIGGVAGGRPPGGRCCGADCRRRRRGRGTSRRR